MITQSNPAIHAGALAFIASVFGKQPVRLANLVAFLGANLTNAQTMILEQGTLTFADDGTFVADVPTAFKIPEGMATIDIPTEVTGKYTSTESDLTLLIDDGDHAIRGQAKIAFFKENFRIESVEINQTAIIISTDKSGFDVTVDHG